MKDYSTLDNYKEFILSYKIVDNKIIVKLASGDDYIIPNTKENENKIIHKMETQIMNIKLKPMDNWDKLLAIFQPLILPLAISNLIHYGGLFYIIILAIVATGTIYYPVQWIHYNRKAKDLEKLKIFLDNKKELNDNIEKNDNMLIGLSSKVKKEIELQESMNNQPININNIDNYSLNDLKKLRENLRRISSFGFNEKNENLPNSLQEEQDPVLKKTLNSKKKINHKY